MCSQKEAFFRRPNEGLYSKIRETFAMYVDELHLVNYINIFRDGLWPGGQLKLPSVPRTAEEKLRTRDEANRKLSALMPGKSCLLRILSNWISMSKPQISLQT